MNWSLLKPADKAEYCWRVFAVVISFVGSNSENGAQRSFVAYA